jgi:hypothetical protein
MHKNSPEPTASLSPRAMGYRQIYGKARLMKRQAFVEERDLRPKVPYRDLLITDGVVNYEVSSRHWNQGRCRLTFYRKDGKVLAIAHEVEGFTGPTIGEGAVYIWHVVKNTFPQDECIFVQGHNGFYEYVTLHERELEVKSDPFNLTYMVVNVSRQPRYYATWSPAGTLEEVLERHLK